MRLSTDEGNVAPRNATSVGRAVPGEVTDVPLRASAEQPPLLERELLYRCDDLRRQSHRRIVRRERLVPDPNFSSG